MVDQDFIDRLSKPFYMFLSHKLAGAWLLLAATVLALVWANSPYSHYYHDWLHTVVTIAYGDLALSKQLSHWVNDGLMGIFFFVVGLEIKREFLAGELSNPKTASLPIFGALGGMVAPALVYIAVILSSDASADTAALQGWGIPMATDIAFALGILAIFPVSLSLKVFLTALAIVDDIGAILVVAIFYTDQITLQSLAVGCLLLLVSVGANAAGIRNPIVYFIIGFAVWVAFLDSGVHATLAAVLMAFTIPARTKIDVAEFCEQAEELLQRLKQHGLPAENRLLTTEQHNTVHSMEQITEHATAPLQELEHALMPFVTFLILPIFALVNAGVPISGDLVAVVTHPIAVGIMAGLFIGKPLGIWLFSLAAVKLRLAELPEGMTLGQVAAVGSLAGIGFTMALFISTLAFADEALVEVAKTAVLLGSLVSAGVGCLLIHYTGKTPARSEPAP